MRWPCCRYCGRDWSCHTIPGRVCFSVGVWADSVAERLMRRGGLVGRDGGAQGAVRISDDYRGEHPVQMSRK